MVLQCCAIHDMFSVQRCICSPAPSPILGSLMHAHCKLSLASCVAQHRVLAVVCFKTSTLWHKFFHQRTFARGICRDMHVYYIYNMYNYIIIYIYIYLIIEGSLEVKLPTIWTDEKQSRGEAEMKRKIRREKMRRERARRKKIQMREKVGKSRNTVLFQWFVAQEGRKVGSLKRRVRSQLVTGAMEKLHAVVARSTFPSQKVQNTSASDDFWKLRCRKSARRCGAKHISKSKCTKRCRESARRCGAKHISKSKCTKHLSFGPLLEVEMSKKCTPLWREAHFQVKSVKNWRSRTTFGSWDVEKVSKKCTPLWREAHFEVKSVKNWGFWAFFDVKMSKK